MSNLARVTCYVTPEIRVLLGERAVDERRSVSDVAAQILTRELQRSPRQDRSRQHPRPAPIDIREIAEETARPDPQLVPVDS